MLTVAKGSSADYFTSQVGAGMEGYYTGAVGAGEPPGRWWGNGAAILGLEGEVDSETMHALYGDFRDPRDPAFADASTRHEAARLGRAPKTFRTPEQVVQDRIREYTDEHASTPTPEQVQAWRIEAERKASTGTSFLDATFSPPKSVTVAHAAFSRAAHEAAERGDLAEAEGWRAKVAAIDAAVQAGNDAMLAHLSEHGGYTRTGRHGGAGSAGQWADGHDWTVASFYQHTSRDHDPQLHVHNAILNRVPCADGTWRAVDSRAVKGNVQGGGAIASAVMQAELSRSLGVEWVMREDGNDFEIAGIEQEVMDLFSSRTRTLTKKTQQLVARAEEQLGYPLNSLQRYRLSKQASLSTRAAKTHDSETEAERLQRWDAMLQGTIAGGLLRTARQLAATSEQRLQQQSAAARATGSTTSASFSADAVIAQALEEVHADDKGRGRSVWGRSDLLRRIHLALPANLGLTGAEREELLGRLTDQALERAVLVAGREIGDVPCPDRLANGMSAAAAPYARLYATPGHLSAEVGVLDAAGARGRHRVADHEVRAWLDAYASTLTDAQREAVAGIASSDAALSILVGPAGTGKSFTAGTLAAAWADLTATDGVTSGRVIGLAIAENAAQVLADDGLADAANIAAFLTAQRRLAEGGPLDGDDRWRVGPRDILAIDEASMLDTYRLAELQKVADAAGARLLLMGDPHQLAAVGAGGMMRTAIDHDAETYTLSDVRRFTADWEREASLQLRDGDPASVLAYDRRGRLRDAGTLAQAIDAVAAAAAADRIAGRQAIVTCGSNEDAASISAAVRRHLVAAGLVGEDGVVLGRDRNTAGVGDLVQARRIDRTLGLVNRQTYTVTGIAEDGSVTVTSTRDGQQRVIPAHYVAEDLTLAYASTAHAAQGATVDVGHLLLTSGMDRAAAYVGTTRGREANLVWAVTIDPTADPAAPPATARGLLDQMLAMDAEQAGDLTALAGQGDISALAAAAADEAHRTSAATLIARIEEQSRLACRERLDGDLDALVADGILEESTRARFGAEQGTEHLSRQLRALEAAGLDPREVLRDAITYRDYVGAVSVSRATAARIEKAHGLPTAVDDAGDVPARIDETRAGYLTSLAHALADQRARLGERVAADAPAWATNVLGSVPADTAELAVWQDKAGQLSAVREATGWDDPTIALGRAPGVSTPHKRLEWTRAWTAAGMPAEKRPAADMSEGQLRARIAAGERTHAHAPASVHEQQRARQQALDDATRDAVLAHAEGRPEDAAAAQARAGELAADVARLDETNTARSRWLIAHAATLNAADDAREEALRRGVPLDREPDRISVEEWLQLQRASERAEEADRVITDADVDDRPHDLDAVVADDATQQDEAALQVEATPSGDVAAAVERDLTPAVSTTAAEAEIAAAAAHAKLAYDRLAEQASQEAALAASEAAAEATDETADHATDAADDEWHWTRTREQESAADYSHDSGLEAHDLLARDDGGLDAGYEADADGLD